MLRQDRCTHGSTLKLAFICALALGGGLIACGDQDDDRPNPPSEAASDETSKEEERAAAISTTDVTTPGLEVPELNPRINRCLQIDRLDLEADDPADANLFGPGPAPATLDPADDSASADEPSCSLTGDYIDWENLDDEVDNEAIYVVGGEFDANNFILPDAISAQGTKDPTAFPFSDERVGEANVLPKQDLVEGSLAYNTDFVYFGLSRQGTNGSSSYFWVFTQEPPHIHEDNENRLIYDITENDVLFVGDFDPSKGDLLQVYQAQFDESGVAAVDAATPENPIWGEVSDTVVAALNTTITRPGDTFHTADGIPSNRLTKQSQDVAAGEFEVGAFAEGAVHMDAFNGASCGGGVFHGTVITRPSRSRNSDLKDLISPFVLVLGDISADITVTGGCSSVLAMSVDQITGPLGGTETLSDYDCDWVVEDSSENTVYDPDPVSCDTSVNFDITADGETPDAADTYSASVTITGSNGASECSTTANGSAFVAKPLVVSIGPEDDKLCVDSTLTQPTEATSTGDTVTYSATVTDGDEDSTNDTYCWKVAEVEVATECDDSPSQPALCDQLTGCGAADTTCTFDFSDDAFCADVTVELTVDDDGDDAFGDAGGTTDSDPCSSTSADVCLDAASDTYETSKKTLIESVKVDEGCTEDADCEGNPDGEVCDTETSECVECTVNTDCPDGVCEVSQNTCHECLDESHCDGGLLCSEITFTCVECEEHSDCALGEHCDSQSNTCQG